MTTALRTPDGRFTGLAGYPFAPNYVEVPDPDGGQLRMHYVDDGPADGQVILCLHGQPTWSYLYRKMTPILSGAGHRVVAPDFIGFGRSDKPSSREDYTYARHVDWLKAFIETVDLPTSPSSAKTGAASSGSEPPPKCPTVSLVSLPPTPRCLTHKA